MAEEQKKLFNEKITYLCPYAPTITVHIGHDSVQAVAGILEVTPEQDRQLQAMMTNRKNPRPDLIANLQKVDMAAAEKLARDYIAKMPPQAQKGATTSTNAINEQQQRQTAHTLTGSIDGKPPQVDTGAPVDLKIIPEPQPKAPEIVVNTTTDNKDDPKPAPKPAPIPPKPAAGTQSKGGGLLKKVQEAKN